MKERQERYCHQSRDLFPFLYVSPARFSMRGVHDETTRASFTCDFEQRAIFLR